MLVQFAALCKRWVLPRCLQCCQRGGEGYGSRTRKRQEDHPPFTGVDGVKVPYVESTLKLTRKTCCYHEMMLHHFYLTSGRVGWPIERWKNTSQGASQTGHAHQNPPDVPWIRR